MLMGARASFCAAHKLPERPEIHGHSYEVWAYTKPEYGDVEKWQERLGRVCKKLDHTTLPRGCSTMERIAEWVAAEMGAEKVVIIRPVEGLACELSL